MKAYIVTLPIWRSATMGEAVLNLEIKKIDSARSGMTARGSGAETVHDDIPLFKDILFT